MSAWPARNASPPTLPISQLWQSDDPRQWAEALEYYWAFVKPENMNLEKSLQVLEPSRIRAMDPHQWYAFLRDDYFRWKYTQPNRYASTTKLLRFYEEHGQLASLDVIRGELLALDVHNIRLGLETARQIRGLGVGGSSGLLALMYPAYFGTVDQFVVKALCGVPNLPDAAELDRMKPESLRPDQGVTLINILRRKAADNNRTLNTATWTPRKIDMILWTYGRSS